MPNLIEALDAQIIRLTAAYNRITRYSARREDFMDQIDWNAMTQEDCRIASMEDEHIDLNLFEIDCELSSICSSYDAIQREWMVC